MSYLDRGGLAHRSADLYVHCAGASKIELDLQNAALNLNFRARIGFRCGVALYCKNLHFEASKKE